MDYDPAKDAHDSYFEAVEAKRLRGDKHWPERKAADAYSAFLERKALKAPERGLRSTPKLADHLFPFQAHCVEHHLRVGAAGCFLDTGLGKTEVQLEFCQRAIEATNERALILTPLAVAGQTNRRASKWGYEARVIRDQSEAGPGINICNYDRLDRIDPDAFGVVSLDEASILKSFTGKTTRALIDTFKGYRFKLAATATPAPNDHMELGNYAELMEIMAANEMLSRFFINDTSTASQQWRLKGHAERPFWDWMASWARMAERPSDLGDFSDEGYDLPPFEIIRHRARDSRIDNELADMFGMVSLSATNLHDVKRQTIEARADKAGEAVSAEPDEPWIIWCDTDYEADALKAAIPSAIEIRGSQSIDEKEEKIAAFETGEARHIIGKPSMMGFGLDWSHCARMAFVGRSYSYETWYQAVRRCWRFGQTRTVHVHLIVAEGESEIGRVIDRKSADHHRMKRAMREAMRRAQGQSSLVKVAYQPNHVARLAPWISAA
ncbi:MAG TPA: helicase-related protein [Rhizobiaceae bacterium]|nr:helicase-related protein [Rhizobiaceae bacterium]